MSDPIRSISQNNYLLSNGGGGHEYSGANGVYVDNVNEVIGLDTSASNAIETVIENSGAWGGAGLPISAGPGINVALENGVLMISNDETVLWSGNHSVSATSALNLSESWKNFEYVEIYGQGYPDRKTQLISKWYTKELTSGSLDCVAWAMGNNGQSIRFNQFLISANNETTIQVYSARQFSLDGTGQSTGTTPSKLTRIVGIGRKSN